MISAEIIYLHEAPTLQQTLESHKLFTLLELGHKDKASPYSRWIRAGLTEIVEIVPQTALTLNTSALIGLTWTHT